MKISLKARIVKNASIDIRQSGVTRQDIEANWTEGVMYGSMNVFNAIYDSDLSDVLAKRLKTKEFQECYLGYSLSNDTFYMGFDTWNPTESSAFSTPTVVGFKLDPSGRAIDIQPMIEDSGSESIMFYGRNEDSPIKELKQQVPDLLDIRLD